MDYLQDEDYEIAEANGIPKANAYHRFYYSGWDKQRAITEPIHHTKHGTLWKDHKEQCESLGIKQRAFYRRVERGMTPEEAASLPPIKRGQHKRTNTVITSEMVSLAASNGICKNTLACRIHQHRWDKERACTEPVHTQFRRKHV